jgi:predicted transcriptional regulator
MQLDRSRELIRMYVARIIDEAFAHETAAARLHQVGLFTLIWMLQGEDEPVTAARLSAMTGLADAQVIRHVQKLVRRDLVKRTKILNKQGRGRAYQLTIKHTAKTKRLVKAIEKGTASRKR